MKNMKVKKAKSRTSRAAQNEGYVNQTVEQFKSLRYPAFVDQKPWLDADGNMVWSQWRMKAGELVFSQSFETAMGLVILFNMGIIMYEADQDALCFPTYYKDLRECPFRSNSFLWLYILNILLNIVYTLECGIRLYVERGAFFCNKWNLIDLLTLMAGWTASLGKDLVNIGEFAVLRMFRLVRVVRAVRVLVSIPEFYLLITGLSSSIKAIIFGSMMLVSVIIFWAVISVELLHPITSRLEFHQCDRCPNGFGSIFAASLTLWQQIVAGDAWGAISIPLVEAAPWTAAILFSILITISLGVLNLILAVIVERAAEARENDQEQKLKRKQQERVKSMEELVVLCANMDVNNNGMVSFAELLQGYDSLPEFKRLMEVMDIKREDMETVFHVLDSDGSGEVSYLEFCSNLGAFFRRDPVIMQSLVKYSVIEVRKILEQDILDVLNEHTDMLRVLLRRDAHGAGPAAGPVGPAATVGLAPVVVEQDVAHNVAPLLQQSSLLPTFQNLEIELQPLLAKAEDIALTAMLSVHDNKRTRRSRVRPQEDPEDPSEREAGISPTATSVVSVASGTESPRDFLLDLGSPSVNSKLESFDDLARESCEDAEAIELELYQSDDLELVSTDPPEHEIAKCEELSLRFKERMHDAQRLQVKCEKMVQLIEREIVAQRHASLVRMKLHKV